MDRRVRESDQATEGTRDWQAELPFLVWQGGVPLAVEGFWKKLGYALNPGAELPVEVKGQVVEGVIPFDAPVVADYRKANGDRCISVEVASLFDDIDRAKRRAGIAFANRFARRGRSIQKSEVQAARPSELRLSVNIEAETVTLDGNQYHVGDAGALFFQVMLDANGDRVGARNHFTQAKRDFFDKLPPELQAVVDRSNNGYRLDISS